MADDGNKGMFSDVTDFFRRTVSPTEIRKDGPKDPAKLHSAPGPGIGKPQAVVSTGAKGALKTAPSEDKAGEKKKGFLGLWGGRRRRKSRRRKTKRRKKKRKSRRRKKTKRRKKKRKSRRRKSRRRKR